MCTRCGANRGRRRQAVLTGQLVISGSPWTLSVAYCTEHEPEEEEKKMGNAGLDYPEEEEKK